MNATEQVAALQLEFERLKERADRLDAQLMGHPDSWLEIQLRMPDTVAEVYVDKALAEARQTALAMATVLKTLQALAGEKTPEVSAVDPVEEARKAREDRLKLIQGGA